MYFINRYLIGICSCICTLVSTQQIKAQGIIVDSQVLLEEQVNPDILIVDRLWADYLNSHPDSLYNNQHWCKRDKEKYKSYDLLKSEGLLEIYDIAKDGYVKNLVLSIIPHDGIYDIRSMFYWMNGSVPYILAITHVYACKEEGSFKLTNCLGYYTGSWKKKTVGRIHYIYNPDYNFNRRKAEEANLFLSEMEDIFNCSIGDITVYISKDGKETNRIKGFDYTIVETTEAEDLVDESATTDIDNSIIYSNATKGELYIHEMMRLILPSYPDCHWLFSQGIAEYFNTESRMLGHSHKELFSKLDDYLNSHTEINLGDLNLYSIGNITHPRYLLGMVMVYLTMKKGGFPLLKDGMRYGSGNEDIYRFFYDRLGIDRESIDKEFRNLIHEFAMRGFPTVSLID